MAKKRPSRPVKKTVGTAGLAVRDAVATAVFMVGAAAVGHLAKPVAPMVGLSAEGTGLGLMLLLLIVMGWFCDLLGGALFNPANNMAMQYALGKGSVTHHTVRVVAQAAGGVAGAVLARALLPPEWTEGLSGMAVGLRPSVGVLDGMACEFVLGALLAFTTLWSGLLDSSVLKLWVPLGATVLAVKAGEHLTGPSLNPVFTFGWNWIYNVQSLTEHLLVFWVAPVASGLFGSWAFLGWQQWAATQQQTGNKQRVKAE